jgi:hypothetical protein
MELGRVPNRGPSPPNLELARFTSLNSQFSILARAEEKWQVLFLGWLRRLGPILPPMGGDPARVFSSSLFAFPPLFSSPHLTSPHLSSFPSLSSFLHSPLSFTLLFPSLSSFLHSHSFPSLASSPRTSLFPLSTLNKHSRCSITLVLRELKLSWEPENRGPPSPTSKESRMQTQLS